MNSINIMKRDLSKKPHELRDAGVIPGVIYGPGIKNNPIKTSINELTKAMDRSGEVYKVESDKRNIFVKLGEIQRDPLKPLRNKVIDLYTYKVSNVVIVGDKELRKKVEFIETVFNLVLIFTNHENVEKTINTKTIALIVDEKQVKPNIKDCFRKLLRKFNLLPIYYLSRKKESTELATYLYQHGLQGVINWPREAEILPELIIESLKPHPKATGESRADKKLSKIIKSHLILDGDYKNINVKVIAGFVYLSGSVKTLYDKKCIYSETSKILGVKRTIVKNISIRKSNKITDKEIERKIKMYISNILGPEKGSLSIRIKDKIVEIIGIASKQSEINDIENFIIKQPGVQEIRRSVKLNPSSAKKNVKLAKQLEKKILNLFDSVKYISVSIYGDYVEVSGTVKKLSTRPLVEGYLLQTLPIKKVINKLFVVKQK